MTEYCAASPPAHQQSTEEAREMPRMSTATTSATPDEPLTAPRAAAAAERTP
jgi:hypothetical protein